VGTPLCEGGGQLGAQSLAHVDRQCSLLVSRGAVMVGAGPTNRQARLFRLLPDGGVTCGLLSTDARGADMGRKVFVVGVGMTKFEKPATREWDYNDMGLEA